MASRIFAFLLLAGFTVLALFTLRNLYATHALAATYGLLAGVDHQPFSPERWTSHWVLMNSFVLAISIIATLGCALVLGRRLWGFTLIAASFFLWGIVPWLIRVLSTQVYHWEVFNIFSTLVLFAIGAICIVIFLRGRQPIA